MKRTMMVLLGVATLAIGMPAIASDQAVSKNVGVREHAQQETIQEKIARLQKEVDKGTSVYSVQDLKQLKLNLKDAEDQLFVLTHSG